MTASAASRARRVTSREQLPPRVWASGRLRAAWRLVLECGHEVVRQELRPLGVLVRCAECATSAPTAAI